MRFQLRIYRVSITVSNRALNTENGMLGNHIPAVILTPVSTHFCERIYLAVEIDLLNLNTLKLYAKIKLERTEIVPRIDTIKLNLTFLQWLIKIIFPGGTCPKSAAICPIM